LYQVLFNAIELRRAPFVAWMQDLSAPDLAFSVGPFPIRLLPLLMAGSGLLQQAVTPVGSSPAAHHVHDERGDGRVFYNLPSGLVLYWTVMKPAQPPSSSGWCCGRTEGSSSRRRPQPRFLGKRR